jgi:hypothetical protein
MIEVIEVHSEDELTAEVLAAVQEALTNLMFGRYNFTSLEQFVEDT